MFWGAKKNLKKNFKNILATALKSYIKWLLYFFFFSFEKVEKTGIISTKFLLRCTPSVILGSTLNFLLSTPWKTVRLHGKKLQNTTKELGGWGQKKGNFC